MNNIKPQLKPLNIVDIMMSIFNQENLIERVLGGIFKNTTTPFNLILVFDGCTDKTKEVALAFIKKESPALLRDLRTVDTPNIFELRANNTGFKMGSEKYLITLQDDVVILEKGWERRLTYPLRIYEDIFAVSSHTAMDMIIDEKSFNPRYINMSGREFFNLPRNRFSIRSMINRGPIAIRADILKEIGYLNEDLVPAYMDDVELCFRAYEKKGMKSGVFWIGFRSDEAWGKSREKIDGMPRIDWNPIIRKNSRYISEHYPKFTSYASHIDEERYVQDSNIDYIEQDSLLIRFGHRFFIDFQNTKTYLAKKQHALKVRLQTNSIHKFLSRRMRTSISRRIGRARNAWSKFSYRAKLRLGIKRPPHNVAELNSLLLHSRAYLHDLEVPVLAACAKSSPGTIVEIGSAFGASSSILLSNMPGGAVLHSTDPFIVDSMGDTLHASKKTCSANVRNVLTTLGMADRLNKWNMHADYSHNVIKTWVMPIDMIFIDGDHRYPAVKQDFEQWFPFVKKGGLILFHDSRKEKSTPEETFNRGWAGPTQLADELRKDPRVALVKEAFSITVWKKN